MALYSMKCKKCGWEGERICRWSEIGNQKCTQKSEAPDGEEKECDGELVRAEEVETSVATPYAWKP